MAENGTLSLWTIYQHPADYPDKYVARRFEFDRPTGDLVIADSLDAIRGDFIAGGLVCIHRSPHDEPQIVETWL